MNHWLLVLSFAVAYWMVGGVMWVLRQRRSIRRAGRATWVHTNSGEQSLEITGHLNLLGLVAWALLPPLVVAFVLSRL